MGVAGTRAAIVLLGVDFVDHLCDAFGIGALQGDEFVGDFGWGNVNDLGDFVEAPDGRGIFGDDDGRGVGDGGDGTVGVEFDDLFEGL